MNTILQSAIAAAQESDIAFSKYITANDTGATGGHQSGYHIHKNAWKLMFDKPGEKGSNKDKAVKIKWQNDFETDSRFIYYGTGTRNEYRLTRFGRRFPFLQDENIGDLLVICKKGEAYYEAYVLQTDEDIENFFAALNISSVETGNIILRQFQEAPQDKLSGCFHSFLQALHVDFPSTSKLAATARNCYNNAYNITQQIIRANPDREILNWLEAEFQLFKTIENDRYSKRIQTPFETVEELVEIANTILNRRKSRAGKSLEHHLAEIFTIFQLAFSSQAPTEGNKRPDFLFPGADAYHNIRFAEDRLFFLAAKTTCKDRWRQILNEADRIKTKHLFTLQQGISENQLKEMYKYNVCLVVPAGYLKSFPASFKERILTLERFIQTVLSNL